MSKIQRLAFGSPASRSQRVAAHNTSATNKDDRAYTSASTAENQNESVKAKASAPTREASKIAGVSRGAIFSINQTEIQNSSITVPALDRADTQLIIPAACSTCPKLNKAKTRPSNINRGAPGACEISSL